MRNALLAAVALIVAPVAAQAQVWGWSPPPPITTLPSMQTMSPSYSAPMSATVTPQIYGQPQYGSRVQFSNGQSCTVQPLIYGQPQSGQTINCQ